MLYREHIRKSGMRHEMDVLQNGKREEQKDNMDVITFTSATVCSRDTMHVSIDISTGSDKYLKYDVNEGLGCVDSPPEPSLLYTKTLLHAFASHVIPDPLTGRTSVEEALRLLQTGLYQPWSPLNESHILFCNV